MQPIKTKKELNRHLHPFRNKKSAIGLVPTMGALHEGHLSLVKRALSENEIVVVSIFVNPTQFDNAGDLKKYPKTTEHDLALLNTVDANLKVFIPEIFEIYSDDVRSREYDFDGLDSVMEGKFREGHFNGVATVVEMLLKIVMPHNAYFGEKDYQQLQIIRKLVASKKFAIKIIGCPIVREASGLAMSSRNARLPARLRQEASFIYKTLLAAKTHFGTKSAQYVLSWVRDQFNKHKDLTLEYIEITDAATLKPVRRKQKNKKYRAFIAVYADGVRLIDNIALK